MIGFPPKSSIAAAGCLVLAGCFLLPDRVESPPFPHRLPRRIDTIVIEPFTRDDGVAMAEADVAYYQEEFRKALESRGDVRTFAEPPHELPSLATVTGAVTGYAVAEAPGEGIYLRTIDIGVRITVRMQGSEDAPDEIARRYAFQKIYLTGENVSTLLFDTQTALQEVANMMAKALLPGEPSEPLILAAAKDPDTGESMAVPALLKANRFAVGGRFSRAVALWEVVLYRPDNGGEEVGYRIGRRTLLILGREGMAPANLEKLEPLTALPPLLFADFRDRLREALEGAEIDEERVLALANERENRIHLNLAAAHRNLAGVYNLNAQQDLASYHYAMAFAHHPSPEHRDLWGPLQTARLLVPGDLSTDEAILLYLSIPPPNHARLIPGDFQVAVLPPSPLRDEAVRARVNRIAGRPAGFTPEQVEPVALPPGEGVSGEIAEGEAPIEAIEFEDGGEAVPIEPVAVDEVPIEEIFIEEPGGIETVPVEPITGEAELPPIQLPDQ